MRRSNRQRRREASRNEALYAASLDQSTFDTASQYSRYTERRKYRSHSHKAASSSYIAYDDHDDHYSRGTYHSGVDEESGYGRNGRLVGAGLVGAGVAGAAVYSANRKNKNAEYSGENARLAGESEGTYHHEYSHHSTTHEDSTGKNGRNGRMAAAGLVGAGLVGAAAYSASRNNKDSGKNESDVSSLVEDKGVSRKSAFDYEAYRERQERNKLSIVGTAPGEDKSKGDDPTGEADLTFGGDSRSVTVNKRASWSTTSKQYGDTPSYASARKAGFWSRVKSAFRPGDPDAASTAARSSRSGIHIVGLAPRGSGADAGGPVTRVTVETKQDIVSDPRTTTAYVHEGEYRTTEERIVNPSVHSSQARTKRQPGTPKVRDNGDFVLSDLKTLE